MCARHEYAESFQCTVTLILNQAIKSLHKYSIIVHNIGSRKDSSRGNMQTPLRHFIIAEGHSIGSVYLKKSKVTPTSTNTYTSNY